MTPDQDGEREIIPPLEGAGFLAVFSVTTYSGALWGHKGQHLLSLTPVSYCSSCDRHMESIVVLCLFPTQDRVTK
ncbi:hypothetical protein [Scytonema sp. PCC 10023]|uniref:hypothetical protein n=1 Tax=Scytonema sp. PCC 10023 TaxID=1680591 RepID=UPI0039C6FA4C